MRKSLRATAFLDPREARASYQGLGLEGRSLSSKMSPERCVVPTEGGDLAATDRPTGRFSLRKSRRRFGEAQPWSACKPGPLSHNRTPFERYREGELQVAIIMSSCAIAASVIPS